MHQVVILPREAPDKPALGAPCNGCGLCCAAELCPLGRLVFRRKRGPCPALDWRAAERRHWCRLVAAPERHLPKFLAPLAARLARRWIAAGTGCDSDVGAETLRGSAKPAGQAENARRKKI